MFHKHRPDGAARPARPKATLWSSDVEEAWMRYSQLLLGPERGASGKRAPTGSRGESEKLRRSLTALMCEELQVAEGEWEEPKLKQILSDAEHKAACLGCPPELQRMLRCLTAHLTLSTAIATRDVTALRTALREGNEEGVNLDLVVEAGLTLARIKEVQFRQMRGLGNESVVA
mmetsp:Transcript_39345/g.59446  ORF Transcript_39345/g.59446 Transcript_39345/m.59446 type:complete len:174 (+) Transcript_39345:156-677(+)|eukprot:CAMPEP_0194752258 /NCGR_PEP_ID=MMETSP0323_2-20130528/6054_1 /TAXON_ID=2866 ORGANISM="Crypthecodinium cohnii, Strain Seligo" /NCGR_SAMPLE_ID=MMETSP0323_2 /ASSEMBLY_ACC=CAM_ASM_000346 /LENGTH=173 /DNA_ID=CAMNT_0039669045 /DNA_START=31 /DNA_END=552 /DNA_ORIENTATION=-